MKLFEVPSNHRVRIKSSKITYIGEEGDIVGARDVIWEGVTTGNYQYLSGAVRRLIVNPSVNFFDADNIWSRDLACEDLGLNSK